ncbi:MAG: hypothetical protein U0350_18905 [Caldilineaceae bacterium]
MNPTVVTIHTNPNKGHSRSVAVPVSIPDLDDVRALAARLHVAGQSSHDRAWGWEVTYEPELDEPEAEVEVPDGKGSFITQVMPLWTPASFTIGKSGVWFFSQLWENGSDQPPVEFLDDRNVLSIDH